MKVDVIHRTQNTKNGTRDYAEVFINRAHYVYKRRGSKESVRQLGSKRPGVAVTDSRIIQVIKEALGI